MCECSLLLRFSISLTLHLDYSEANEVSLDTSLGVGVDRAVVGIMTRRILNNIQYFDIRHEGFCFIVASDSNNVPPS